MRARGGCATFAAVSDTPRETDLRARLAAVGKRLGEREAAHAGALAEARAHAEALRARVAEGLEAFREAAAGQGAGHLGVEVSATRPDDKHVRAVQFELSRGRHRAIVTVKSRGEVTLVGPFRTGKPEGPCRTFPVDAGPEIGAALGDFLERFLEEAATP